MMNRIENLLYAVLRLFVALVLVAGISWGVILTAAQLLGVPQSQVMGVVVIAGLIAGVAMMDSGKRHSTGSSPVTLAGAPASRVLQPASSRWRELRDIERCRQEGLISDEQFQIERARILGPERPKSR
jgi:hypothetical protein